ncbi:hypothetical protein QWY92_00815 [Algibacter miyuki]|uniref:hypothetical protein n=1 Tax=Algibacter miyuki TaxID=1306933 RepID=UPI0025B3AAE1|nr:hypothetical protein [Algibacter miyuki]MDN3663957.1 hypothetical protein [Algibacter miyuki]
MKINTTFSIVLAVLISLSSCNDVNKKELTKDIETRKKPNIVFILTDQWRGSALGYAGNPDVKTPHLDAFAKTSVNLKLIKKGTSVFKLSAQSGSYNFQTTIKE